MVFRLIAPIRVLALTVVLSGCASALHPAETGQHTPSSQGSDIVGYRWQITEVRHDTVRVAVPQGSHGYVAFSPNGVLNADDGVNHYYGHFTSTADGYRATDVGTTLVGYIGHDPVTLALIGGVGALTMHNVDVVESLTGNRLELSAGGYHVTATRAGHEPVQPTPASPTSTHS